MRIRLDIAYDGSHFRGWATQPGLRTVQGSLEGALERILGGQVRLVVAGRTDAGVHATGQVAHFDVDDTQAGRLRQRRGNQGEPADAVTELGYRVRGILGSYSDVTVTRASIAPVGFDARFSAIWRRYRYRISDYETGYDPLLRHDRTTVKGVLDLDAMNAAASSLIGLHDFAAYCKPRERATTVRTLLDFQWERDTEGVVTAKVRADAFCHSMVRALAGACVAVGLGRMDVGDAAALRDARARTSVFPVIAARGLTLTEVGYPSDELLAVRAEQTRARRRLEEERDEE
ncbi:tRNA pseudouridine38-40 synthase [Microbacterium endophyticum]|uniref:tRNA pseudouridine synthase A n=1 Tax=Microbacterium endophyticum TaxID=1526412 RepID=A0A7W4V260_9MICO|nr:tRNA pseudouridine(38-40) synthase TruA [Microbacterium endophyticum]MBB2975463.1 tRNA pseudouridine38-40 synthase [Microbacterium endophyticum]NIK35518.1 tRNA pseudouridine38-40 synthase [Microbacterium endophyticum]